MRLFLISGNGLRQVATNLSGNSYLTNDVKKKKPRMHDWNCNSFVHSWLFWNCEIFIT